MMLYHGTTEDKAQLIQQTGLKPNPDAKFDLQNEYRIYSLREVEPKAYVFLTRSKDVAKWFANFRAEYESAEPQQQIGATPFTKLSGSAIIPAPKPAVVTVELPKELAKKFRSDPLLPNALAKRGTVAIPPEYVKAVDVLPITPDVLKISPNQIITLKKRKN